MSTFGSDPIDIFSIPTLTQPTQLGFLFTLTVRQNDEKPGRAMSIVWDARQPLIKGFENQYSYLVRFKGKGKVAANHYHKVKEELFFPVVGSFTVVLENPETKVREEIVLEEGSGQCLFVPRRTAHVVRAEADQAILLCVASSAGVLDDEFGYKLL